MEEVRTGYLDNLYLVMEEAKKLINTLPPDKRIVITADHGELLGLREDNYMLGHADDLEHPNLRTIPWFEVKR